MKISITVEGAEIVRKGLEDLHAEIPKIGRQQIRTVMNRIVREMQAYPRKRPRQTYVRTGNLFSHWQIKELKEKGQNGYSIDNRARSPKGRRREYARFVVGSATGKGQAWMHRGRWQLLRDVVDEEVKKLPKAITERIVMVARGKGFEAKVTNG